jgi:thiamine pyrophosphate-dependent acetolactate synthase large subunit-like protein
MKQDRATKGSDLLVAPLVNEGVDRVFGVPGEENLDVVVLNDSAYGMIRWKQAVDKFSDFGLTFGNPDFVKCAEAYGAKGSRSLQSTIWCRRSRLRSMAVACTWSTGRSITARTFAFSSTS